MPVRKFLRRKSSLSDFFSDTPLDGVLKIVQYFIFKIEKTAILVSIPLDKYYINCYYYTEAVYLFNKYAKKLIKETKKCVKLQF